jgi:hypothetical protein
VLGLTVLYFASFGPACWIASREHHANRRTRLIGSIYRPIMWGLSDDRLGLGVAIRWYATFGANEGWAWVHPTWSKVETDGTISTYSEWMWFGQHGFDP